MTDIIEAHGRTYTRCCGTCRHWKQSVHKTRGYCEDQAGLPDGTVAMSAILTLDLALCSKWQEKDEG